MGLPAAFMCAGASAACAVQAVMGSHSAHESHEKTTVHPEWHVALSQVPWPVHPSPQPLPQSKDQGSLWAWTVPSPFSCLVSNESTRSVSTSSFSFFLISVSAVKELFVDVTTFGQANRIHK